MNDSILKTDTANFYGLESIDSSGKRHYHPLVIKGNGKLILTENELRFNQWISQKEYSIPLNKITKVEIKAWHNLKIKFPGKVLRIYYTEESETKIFGISVGGNLSFTKGWQDGAPLWKEKIESLLKEKIAQECASN